MSDYREEAKRVLTDDFDEVLFWMCREGDYAGIYAEICWRLEQERITLTDAGRDALGKGK